MGIFDKLKNSSFVELIKDQRLNELFIHREFRITADYFSREVVPLLEDDEVSGLTFTFHDGYGEVAAQVKKRFIPFTIQFSARLKIARVDFTTREKKVHIRLEEVKPVDFDWLTRKIVERLPYLSYGDGTIVCDLTRVPSLGARLDYRVKGIRVSDFLTIKALDLREGELFGRLGVVL